MACMFKISVSNKNKNMVLTNEHLICVVSVYNNIVHILS